MAEKLFGTDGVRGVANVYPMTVDFAMKLAMAAANVICVSKKRVAIAKDTRLSSDMLETAMIAGFTSQGVDVLQMGVIPTPALTYLTERLDVDMSVMITASHNPYQDNGIKLIGASGDKLSDVLTTKLEDVVASGEFSYDKDKIGRVIDGSSNLSFYEETIEKVCQTPKALEGLKVVVDCANGCFSKIMPTVFEKLGAKVIALSTRPDGININNNCGSQHIENMAAKVVEIGADIGIAADGDGDRIIICDEKGNKIDGDQILAFLGRYFKSTGRLKADTVVATIVSNPGLDRFLNEIGVRCERSAVGERYVVEKMRETGSNFGGEESGHMVAADYSKTGDTLVTGLLVAEGLKRSNQKMSELFPLFTPVPRVRTDSKFDNRENMLEAFDSDAFKQAEKNAIADMGEKCKLLIRKSGTEPKIQVWVWADDAALAAKVGEEISSALKSRQGFVSVKTV